MPTGTDKPLTRSMPGMQSSSSGTMCFCPPSQSVSFTNGSAPLASAVNTAVVRCVSFTSSSPLYARSRISGMMRLASSMASTRSAPWAYVADMGSLAKMARSVGVRRLVTKARRMAGVSRRVCGIGWLLLWRGKRREGTYYWSLARRLLLFFPSLAELYGEPVEETSELEMKQSMTVCEGAKTSILTASVQWPVFEGWKKDSVLVINLSSESRARDPAKNPFCVPSLLSPDSPRTGPSSDIE